MRRRFALVFVAAGLTCALGLHASEEAPNPVERVAARMANGSLRLQHDGTKKGYLMSVLEAFGVDVSSQVMVFSKTSLQMDRIGPKNPRGLYYNDETIVGYVPDGQFLEFATFDAERGVVFYAIDLAAPGPLKIEQHTGACGSCHSMAPRGRMVVESVYPMADGAPFISLGTIEPLMVDHRTKFEERWGGWYVTGTSGTTKHRGNSLPKDEFKPFDLTGPSNITTLKGLFDISKYPLPTSDLISLMVFEHQMYITNLMAKLNRIVRRDERVTGGVPGAVEELVQALFYSGEARLESPIKGASAFEERFAQRSPKLDNGRSLFQFDLNRRLMRYPFSFMVYSPVYDAIPADARQMVATRVRQVLAGDGSAGFEHVSAADRAAITEILRATKPEFFDVR